MDADLGVLIPIIAVVGGLSIPLTAIVVDYKRRKLIAEERRAMIEKGMVPPPMPEKSIVEGIYEERARRRLLPERNLRSGLVLLALGLGLATSVVLIQTTAAPGVPDGGPSFGLIIGAAVTSFLGLGNLLYYLIVRRKTPPDQG